MLGRQRRYTQLVLSRVAATGGLKLEPASKLTVTLANGSLVSSVSQSFLRLEIPSKIPSNLW